jgi:hypothetical protein
MMEATHPSETSADIDLTTRQYIPEDSVLHTRRRENLKSHISAHVWVQMVYGRESLKITVFKSLSKLFIFFDTVWFTAWMKHKNIYNKNI